MKLLWAVLVPLVTSRATRPQHQAPVVEVEAGLPAIGLHLTTSYAVAAVRHANGELEDLVKVTAGAEYVELMTQWADPANKVVCPPGKNDALCQLRRTARQRNTGNTGVLSSFLQEVKVAIESKLQTTITDVFPVFPPLAAIDTDDVAAAFEHAGLTWNTIDRQYHKILWESNAAYAGLGFGLCDHWTDKARCEKEDRKKPWEFVLFLNFDNSSFSATLQYMQDAYAHQIAGYQLDPKLGWWDVPVYEFKIERAEHFTKIENIIFDVAGAVPRPPKKIILMGDHGLQWTFINLVRNTLFETFGWDASLLIEANSGWWHGGMTAARGAAEMAFRSQVQRRSKSKGISEQENMEL